MQSSLVNVFRQNSSETGPFEIKDPCVVPMPDGSYIMYATIFGQGIPDEDVIGRFHSNDLRGPWNQLESAHVSGLSGPGHHQPEVCAPQVLLSEENGQQLWTMYVQTSCFREDAYIAMAVSHNGRDFQALPTPAVSRHAITGAPVVALYDVSVSEIQWRGTRYECMVFSGYRQFLSVAKDPNFPRPAPAVTQSGSGDLYMSLRQKNAFDQAWSVPHLILKQEDIPFHNQPGSKNFEWGLEAGKIVQVDEDSFLLAGVCFLDKEISERGTRQRIFFASAISPLGPFLSQTLPIEPTHNQTIGQGENGHPDVLDIGDRLCILYQERAGIGYPWHLRYAEISKRQVRDLFTSQIPRPDKPAPDTTKTPASP